MDKRPLKYKLFAGTDINGVRLNWSGVFAGIASFIAIFLTLSLIGFSIGLTTLNPLSDNPLKHVGTNVTIWTIIALILSFAAGGFISGLVSNKAGFLHGFMTWALGLILVATLVTSTFTSALGFAGNTVTSIVGGVGSTTSKLVTKSGQELHKAVDSVSVDLTGIDLSELETQLNQFLQDTDVKELQPGYLNEQLKLAGEDIKETSKNILMTPDNYKEELNSLLDKLEAKEKNIAQAVDEEAISNAVSKNTELTEEEANIAVENIKTEYFKALDQVEKGIQLAREEIDTITFEVEETTEEVKENIQEGADKAADIGSKSTMYLFIGLILSMLISGYFGMKGANYLDE